MTKNLSPLPFFLAGLVLLNNGCGSRQVQTHTAQPSALTGNNSQPGRTCPADTKGGRLLKEMQTRASEELTLPSDSDIPELGALARAWVARTETVCFETTLRNGVAAKMAVRQIAGQNSDTVYVCIHGLFGESDNWKYLAAAMGSEHEIWVIDLVGAGLSDCPDPDRVGPGGYSPEALGERVLQALQARLVARPEVSRLIVVAHSFGGMVTLRMFMNEDLRQRYAEVLNKVQGLALFAPCDVYTRATEDWVTFFGVNNVKAGVGSALQILQHKVVASVRESFCNPQLTSRELAQSGIRVLREGQRRRAQQAIMRDAVPWRVFCKRLDFNAVKRLEESYRNVSVPCLVVWGECDETLPEAMGYKLKDQLPDARLVVLSQTKHLLPLERPRICADLTRQFRLQINNGTLSAAHTVQTLDPVTYEQSLLAGEP